MRRNAGSTIKLFLMAVVVLGAVMAPAAGRSSAQDTGTPPPWDCTVDAVGLLSLLEIVNELEDAQSSAGMTPIDQDALMPGEPVSAVDREGITETTWQLAACVNAEDPFRVAALFTPRFQARLVLDLLSGEDLGALADQVPLIVDQVESDEGLQMIPILDAWYSPSSAHEVEAILAPAVEGMDEQRQYLVRFIYSETMWLIDELRPIEGASVTGDATPASPTGVAPATPVASPTDSGWSPFTGESVTIASRDIFFVPDTITIPADTPVTLALPNEGQAPHNFSIDELGIDIDIAPGDTQNVDMNAPAGTYEFYCDIPGHRQAGMVGTLIVE